MSNIPPTPSGLRGAVDLSSLVDRAQRPPQPPAGAPAQAGSPTGAAAPGTETGADLTVPSLVLDVTDDTFQDVLQLSSVVPVIVDIWAEWCGPCKQLSPILEQLTAEYGGRVLLAKVDADTNPQLVQAFQAQSIPTVAALIGGRPLGLFVGRAARGAGPRRLRAGPPGSRAERRLRSRHRGRCRRARGHRRAG